jgi:FtsH-binding integral membrane protein
LIITWWIGAGIACLAILIHRHNIYALVGTIGWTITITSTALIIYEIKRIKEENKELMENDRK